MQRFRSATAALSPDTPDTTEDPGYFTAGSAMLGVSPSVLNADWLNNVQEEICSVIEEADLTLDDSARNQLLLAIQALIEAAVAAHELAHH